MVAAYREPDRKGPFGQEVYLDVKRRATYELPAQNYMPTQH